MTGAPVTGGCPLADAVAPPPGGVVPLAVPAGAAGRHGARVWLGRVAPAGAEDRAALDAAETARAARMAPGHVRERYVAARAAIRRLLAAELGCAPRAVRWGRHPCPRCPDPAHGRPRLTAPAGAPEVGVSRTGPWWLLAVADAPVGADVEHLSPAGRGALVRRCFSAAERRWLAELPKPERAAALARGWARKEAVTKAWGVGTAAGLGAVEVLAGAWDPGASRGVVRAPDGGGWEVCDLPVPRAAGGDGRWPVAALALPAE